MGLRFDKEHAMTRILIATALLALAAIATPAAAREGACTSTPQIRSAAATARPEQAQKALRAVATAEKLCEEGNDRAARDKLALAMKTLGVEQASLTAPAAGQ